MKTETNDFPPAAVRTLQILDLFLEDSSSKSLKTISEKLSIPFTSLYRIASCMKEYQYLVEDPANPNHLRLGYKLTGFSDIISSEKYLIKIAHPFMKQICNDLGQACQLCILSSDGVCTIDQCLPKSTITYITRLNEVIPINVSASGKLLTALLPKEERARFLKKATLRFTPYTEKTITDPALFSEHLEQIAAQGYGTDDEEYAIGVGCVAVPIHTPDNKIIAAVGTTGPVAPYKTPESFNSMLEHLKETAQQIEERMF